VRLFFAAILISVISCCAFGQTYTIHTFAGGGLPVNIPGTSASLSSLNYVAVDGAGNVLFTDRHHAVLRLDAKTGVLTLVAGNGTPGYSGDNGPATSAQLNNPRGVAVDAAGNLYIADWQNNRIRKVSNGVIATVAGNGTCGNGGDNGPAASAQVCAPNGVALDAAGNLYIADTGNHRIRKVSNGVITTVAGNGVYGYGGDNGPAIGAQLRSPSGVAADSAGNLYIADWQNNRIRKVSNGVITTVAGNGVYGYGGDNGPATSAQVGQPLGVALDAAGNLYIADTLSARVRKVSNGVITTVAGNGTCGNGGDNGPAASAQVCEPNGVALDAAGNLYIADYDRIRKVSSGMIATVAGGGSVVDDNGPATSAQLRSPSGVAADSAGNLYIADQGNRIRKVSNGVITTVAGNGTPGYSGDNGPAASAQLTSPYGAAVDSAGNLYIADDGNHLVRKVSNGVVTTVAGGGASLGDNGPATSARLTWPCGVAVDSAGNLYIADQGDNRIRRVSNGVITTVAGDGTWGYSGDNGPATSAQLSGPWGVAVDAAGNLYIADTRNNRIRKVSNGVIATVAGNGTPGFSGDNGPASNAQLNGPWGVAVDAAGNLYIADSSNYRIRMVSNGVIATVAGSGLTAPSGGGGFSGDYGPATSAQLNSPSGVALDSAGNLYIADTGNDRIRVLIPSGQASSPSMSAVTNAASNLPGAISPGEIVVLYGSGIGPAQLVKATPGSDGSYGTQVANTSVSFNGIAAPMIYTWATQVAAIVPYGITGTTAQVTVTYQGQTSAAFSVSIASSAPGIFTSDSTGQGQAAAINQDGITVNTAATPTKVGDIISLYATGEGQTTPTGVDGKAASVPFPYPNLPVTATVGGQTALVKYAGGAPGMVAGLMQVNVQIPAGIQTGNAVQVVLRVGDVFSQGGVTIAVR
jgi:uncharacterized protein (TIGR03437 family)